MSAVWRRVRAELRARARATVALAVLIGIGGGAVLGSMAAARRTDSAYPRFLEQMGGAHILASDRAGGEGFFGGRELSVEDFAAMPSVMAAQKLRFYLIRNPLAGVGADDEGFITAEARSPSRSGSRIDGYKILEGRAPDPDDPGEAVVTIPGSRRRGLRVGARFALEGVPDVFPDFAAAVARKPLQIRIVGRAAVPGDFPPQSGDETIALRMTPAFYERYPELAFGFQGGVALRLRGGSAAADRFRADYVRAGGNAAFTIERSLQDANVQRSLHLQATSLWILAALAAIAFVLVFAQTLARQIFLESDDHPAMRALGFTRTQLAAAAVARAVVAALGGVALAIAGALATSLVTPTGLARVAEPDPGLHMDWPAVSAGGAGVLFVVVVLAALPAWRVARAGAKQASLRAASPRPSFITEVIARSGAGASLVAGSRFALQRGRGRSAMPVGTTVASLTLGLAVLTAAGTFAFSMNAFLDTPRLYGVTWDARVGVETPESFSGDEHSVAKQIDVTAVARRLAREPGVRGVAVGRTGTNISIGSLLLEALVMEPAGGRAPMPPLLQGRYPRARPAGDVQEMALGRRALERARARVGDVVEVDFLDYGSSKRVRIVGVAVIPLFVDTSRLGDAALIPPGLLTESLGLPLDFRENDPTDLFISGRVDLQRIAELAGQGTRAGEDVHIWPAFPPTDVVNFGRVHNMPLVLGGILAAFAAATLAHTLITAIARRRRDLAILKTLGFVRAQVRRAVRAQALVLVALALVIGVPAGIALGRWIWTIFASELGVIVEPVVRMGALGAGAAATIALAIAIAAVPGRLAARTQPAMVLRSE